MNQKLVDDYPVSTQDIMKLAQKGGSFNFLNEQPDIYSLEDGEAI